MKYHAFITGALREAATHCSPKDYIIKVILANAFELYDSKECDENVMYVLDTYDDDVMCEMYHKQFRQVDMTGQGALDMIIYHAMQQDTDIFKILKWMSLHREKFVTRSTKQLIDDYFWDADF